VSMSGVVQQSFTRFTAGVPTKAPTKPTFTVTDRGQGKLRVRFTSSTDLDNNELTYRIYRDAEPEPILTTTVVANFWAPVKTPFKDTRPVGVPVSYVVEVSDGDNVVQSFPITITPA